MEMSVDMLMAALSDAGGSRIVKIYGNGSMDADIAEVHIDEVNDERKVPTVTIVTEHANNHLKELLDAFFENRLPLEAPGYMKSALTTDEIIDMLEPMMSVDKPKLLDYMSNHGYQIRHQLDGIPRWMVYSKWAE